MRTLPSEGAIAVLDHLLLIMQHPSVQIALSGAMGGVVRWLRLREPTPEGIRSVIIGMICAFNMSDAVAPLFEPVLRNVVVDPVTRSTFIGFMIGFSGTAVAGFITDLLNARKGKD